MKRRIKDETMIQSINKKLWIVERSNACRAHNYRILLTDERMNCYCCLSKMNEKFSLLYKKSLSFIYLLIFHLLIHRDSFENRDLRLSRRFFLLIKLSSFLVVTSIWSHQNRIFIFELIDFSTISKISKFERNYFDWMIVERLDAKSTNWWRIDDTNRLK
jgi:hypothetical protein